MGDIDYAISSHKEAVELAPEIHPDRPIWLSGFGNSLQRRFERLGDVTDIDRAISALEEAIELTPKDHPYRSMFLSNLGSSLQMRFQQLGNIADIDRAISTEEEAVELTPEGHPERPVHLSNFGNSLQTKFTRLGDVADIDRAISALEEAVELIPKDHPDRPTLVFNLGNSLQTKFEQTKFAQDLEDAKSRFADALRQSNGPPIVRIRAGRSAGLLYAASSEWIQASKMFETAVELLPKISPRSLTRDDLQYALTTLSGLSALAASTALQAKKPASDALAFLESGRGVISSIAIDSRSDLSDLEEKSQSLFGEYSALRQQLSLSHSRMGTLTGTSPNTMTVGGGDTLLATISKQNRLVEELERVEKQIRAEVPGYKNFQRPSPPSYFTDLAKGAALVAFNITLI